MSRPSRPTRRLVAAVLTTAAAGLVAVSVDVAGAPAASAATCGSSAGVSVVVDFGSLGGGVQSGCVAGGAGQRAASLFPGAGFDLSYVQDQGGFVCRIDARPSPNDEACVDTPPADAYWALWWSDGTSGSWSFSSLGVNSLKVPDGGYVGFAWQTGSKNAPDLSPAPHTSTPTPTQAPSQAPSSSPSSKPTRKPGSNPTKPTAKPSSTTASSTTASSTTQASSGQPTVAPSVPDATSSTPTSAATPTVSGSESAPLAGSPSAAPSIAGQPGGTTTAAPSSDPSSVPPSADPGEPGADSGGALPAWVVPVVLVLLLLAGAATALVRRRNRPSP